MGILHWHGFKDGHLRFSSQPEGRRDIIKQDESIVINSCHGPMREAEVLRDYLLRRFAEDSTLRPKDIDTMMRIRRMCLISGQHLERDGKEHAAIFSIFNRRSRTASGKIIWSTASLIYLRFFRGRATNRDVLDLIDSICYLKNSNWDDDVETFSLYG